MKFLFASNSSYLSPGTSQGTSNCRQICVYERMEFVFGSNSQYILFVNRMDLLFASNSSYGLQRKHGQQGKGLGDRTIRSMWQYIMHHINIRNLMYSKKDDWKTNFGTHRDKSRQHLRNRRPSVAGSILGVNIPL